MPEFLAEAYVARSVGAAGGLNARDLVRAAGRLSRQGRTVRLTGCIFVPEDEIGLYLFQAQSADAVRDAAASCGVRFERVVEAVSGWQSETS
ncbi:MAG TPA: hypothetical protein VGS19_09440 [Streptosporangiaceae bacterium]|nr:hypothetical protein [Streptosporangiaceae bacterium]